jgi:hypothetical protein
MTPEDRASEIVPPARAPDREAAVAVIAAGIELLASEPRHVACRGCVPEHCRDCKRQPFPCPHERLRQACAAVVPEHELRPEETSHANDH